jgi:hypothetical protein
MHYSKSVTGAAVLLALAPSAFALGTATLYNNCGFDIWYADISTSPEGMTMLPSGAAFSAGYSDPGVGYSIKVAPSDSINGPITQFEYTWSTDKISYDISNINGNPFAANGVVLSPSMAGDPNYPTCQVVNCPAGESVCTAAYNQPDDTDTMVCDEDSSLVMTVCTSSSAKEKREPVPEPEPVAVVASPLAIMHEHQRIHARHYPKK